MIIKYQENYRIQSITKDDGLGEAKETMKECVLECARRIVFVCWRFIYG